MSRSERVDLPVLQDVHPYSRKARQIKKRETRTKRLNKQGKENDRAHRQKSEPFLWFKAVVLENPEKKCFTADEADSLIEDYLIEKNEKLLQKKGEITNKYGKINRNTRLKCELFERQLKEFRENFHSVGIELPDITSHEGVSKLRGWEGDWSWISGKLIPVKNFRKMKIELPESFREKETVHEKE